MTESCIPEMGFHHIAVCVKDFDRELRFFTEGLGLKPYTAWSGGEQRIMLLEIGDGGMVELFSNGIDAAEENNRYTHFALRVPDVEASFDRAVKAGAAVVKAPAVHRLPSAPVALTLQCAFIRTPGGAEIEFVCVVDAKGAEGEK